MAVAENSTDIKKTPIHWLGVLIMIVTIIGNGIITYQHNNDINKENGLVLRNIKISVELINQDQNKTYERLERLELTQRIERKNANSFQ